MDARAYRTFQALSLAALAVFLLVKIASGEVLLWIHQQYVLLLILAALALLLLAQWAMRSRLENQPAPAGLPLSPHERLWWLALPLLAGVLLPSHVPEPALSTTPQTTVPAVLYLSPVDAPELWRKDLSGDPRVLTATGGQVVDFSVAPDGQWILYSLANDQGGVDLWEMRSNGVDARLLLPCGSDACTNPALHPDGVQIAYSRRQSGVFEMEGAGAPRLWLLDRASLATEQLHADPNIGGYEPAWSPDGRWLAYFDGLNAGVRAYDITTGAETLLPSQMGVTGAWGPDGRLYYLETELRGELPAVLVYWFQPADGTSGVAFGDSGAPRDFSLPAIAPDGASAAVALRPLAGGPVKQLWLFSLQNGEARELIVDPTHHYGAVSWDATGARLLFQRLETNQSDSRPQVAYWDGESVHVLAEDAYQPHWLP